MAMAFGRDRPWGSAVLAMATASFLVLASSVARADGGDADGDLVPDDIEDRTERTVDGGVLPAIAPRNLFLSSNSVGAPADDRFRLTYEQGAFDLTYFREDTGGYAGSFTAKFDRLFEWADADGNGLILDDEIVSDWSLGGSAFENLTMSHREATSADGGFVHTFELRSTWRPGTDAFLVLTAAQRFLRLGPDRILTPMEVKMDLHLNHTFEVPGSRVGIALRVESSDESAMDFEHDSWDARRGFSSDESWINITSGARPSTMFFSWANNATADGVEGPLVVRSTHWSELPEEGYELLLAFPEGLDADLVRIVHDPTLGVVSAAYEGILLLPPPPDLQGDALLYGVSLVAMAALVGTTVLLAGRRRRKGE
ncbi:MAG: hypothetical protein A3K59_04380 [Euryarchaeota archaeon RBG_19FT_COMBO_69_17]|nr:MAG: hypothetical protein A3K59_04380 [Euryarchaeota archaeon RBG_19FT_COMBO_69_17]